LRKKLAALKISIEMESSSNKKTYALFATPLNRKLAAALEAGGAKVFGFEPVETGQINSRQNSEIIKNNLHEFDWIIFPDVYAVEFFIGLLEENQVDLFELDAAHVLAFGEAVTDRLRFVQLHADIIPPTIETEIVFQTLTDYLGKENLSGLRFIVPREGESDSDLKRKLIKAGTNVTEIAVYQIKPAEKNKTANLKALLKGGAIDELIISSAEDVVSLKHYLSTENLSESLSEVRVSGTNEISMQTLKENNLRPHFFVSNKKG
jgi:uroporphyrinogen-III synthase